MFNVTPRWLRTHKDKLPHSKPSHKVLIFPRRKVATVVWRPQSELREVLHVFGKFALAFQLRKSGLG